MTGQRFLVELLASLTMLGLSGCSDDNSRGASQQTKVAGAKIPTADILGVRIGMTPDEVKAELAKATKLIVSEHRSTSWPVMSLSAEGQDEVVWVFFTETEPRAWFIGRSFGMPNGQRPLRDNLARQAAEKYGAPVSQERGLSNSQLVWAWQDSGERLTAYNICLDSSPVAPKSWGPSGGRGETPPFFLRTSYNKTCGLYIEMHVQAEVFDPNDHSSMPSLNGNRDLAAGASVALTSAALYRSDPKNPIDMTNSREKATLDQAAKVKPPKL